VLLGSGLRVSELLGLRREQYTGRGFENVLIKGGRIREFVPVQSHARRVLDEWLNAGAAQSGFIFTTRTGKALTRSRMFEILQRAAAQANAHRQDGERIDVSPHVLRHYSECRIMPSKWSVPSKAGGPLAARPIRLGIIRGP
jgi:site-specific recombinase XerC